MEAVRTHLRLHGTIHALWIIASLVAVIAALILMSPNGKSVGEYIGFATAIASLVLAVVAIGQSLITNQSFSETVGSLKLSAEDVKTAAAQVADVSSVLSGQSDELLREVTALPPAMKAIHDRLEQRLSEDSTSNGSKKPLPFGDLDFNEMANGLRLALYCIVRSYNVGRPIQLDKLTKSTVWRNWISGSINTIEGLKSFDIEIVNDPEGRKVESIGAIDSLSVERQISGLSGDSLDGIKAEIELFFSSIGAATPGSDGPELTNDGVDEAGITVTA